MKPKHCAHCGTLFMPMLPLAKVCSPACAMKYTRAKKVQDKRALRERKAALRPIGQLEEDCRRIVQAIARIRDRHDGCISCHVGPNYDGQWHGSHFRAHGGCSSVQFHLWNIHKACAQCNYFKGGNIAAYRPRLIEKIGADRVEWLECQPKSKKFSRDYLNRFKTVMGKRLRRMEKSVKEKS